MNETCLLPGPVAISANVQRGLHAPPLYHRGAEFLTLFENVRSRLAALTGAREVALFTGSGTLANEVVATTLAALAPPRRGLILENGEFGRRLISQAECYRLEFTTRCWPWGRPWDLVDVAHLLEGLPPGSWVWGVHHETSTGVLNDLPGLVSLARQRGISVCVDAISSLGGSPLDLRDVFLASGTSGKALGAACGIAIVFVNRQPGEVWNRSRLPTYLDLAAALDREGPRFTFSSIPLTGLAAALDDYSSASRIRKRLDDYAETGRFVRSELHRLGLNPLAEVEHAASTVTTFAPPAGCSSNAFVEHCRGLGFLIGGQSEYLARRRLVQIATMGATMTADCARLLDKFKSDFTFACDKEPHPALRIAR